MTGDEEVIYSRVHRAPRDLVFACMTTPEHLTRFWGPSGTTTPLDGIVVDLRPGGAFETTMVSDADGSQHVMRAVYEAVDAPALLSWREAASGMVTTLRFVEVDPSTTEVITHQQHLPEGRRTPEARAGWATSLDRFAAYVTTLGPSDWQADLRGRLDELLDDYRAALHDALDGLTEEEARASLVPSKTTLLGLLKHVTYVEGVWFDQAVTGRTATEAGIPSDPDRSFTLTAADTITTVQAAHRLRTEASRRTMAGLGLEETVTGKGERSVWALYVQVLRELAQHAGHVDILREQVLARRP